MQPPPLLPPHPPTHPPTSSRPQAFRATGDHDLPKGFSVNENALGGPRTVQGGGSGGYPPSAASRGDDEDHQASVCGNQTVAPPGKEALIQHLLGIRLSVPHWKLNKRRRDHGEGSGAPPDAVPLPAGMAPGVVLPSTTAHHRAHTRKRPSRRSPCAAVTSTDSSEPPCSGSPLAPVVASTSGEQEGSRSAGASREPETRCG